MGLFAQALAPTQPVSLSNLGDKDLMKLASRYVKPINGGWMSVIYVYPTGGKWSRDVPPKLLAVPERDDHPATRALAKRLKDPAEVVAISGDWRS